MKFILLSVVVLIIANGLLAKIDEGRTLVLIDNYAYFATHSMFFNELYRQYSKVDIKLLNTHEYQLKEYDQYNYDNLILICTSEQDSTYLPLNDILAFYDNGGRLMVLSDIDTSKNFRAFINNLGFDLHAPGSVAIDHINGDAVDPKLFLTSNIINLDMFSKNINKGVYYKGIAFSVSPYENDQIFSILRGMPTTYSKKFEHENDAILAQSHHVVLMSAAQGLKGQRIIISGSIDIYSNELLTKSDGDNLKFMLNVLDWFNMKSGNLRFYGVDHHRIGETEKQSEYKTSDEIHFEMKIEEYDSNSNSWKPYIAKDVVLELYLMDPYIRTPLNNDGNTSLYYLDTRLPDKIGVYKWIIKYRRPGYSFIDYTNQVSIRPWNHDEYSRYIIDAYPYYIGVFGTMIGFFVFSIFFLLNQEKHHTEKQKTS